MIADEHQGIDLCQSAVIKMYNRNIQTTRQNKNEVGSFELRHVSVITIYLPYPTKGAWSHQFVSMPTLWIKLSLLKMKLW